MIMKYLNLNVFPYVFCSVLFFCFLTNGFAQSDVFFAPIKVISTDSITFKKSDITYPKRKLNLNLNERITPMAAYKLGGDLVLNGDSAYAHSVEIGVGLIRGSINNWQSWGPLPLGWDWNYLTLPFVTVEYRWIKRYYEYPEPVSTNYKINPFMLNVGVSTGGGILLSLIPVPIGINGMAGLSTDFNQLYFRGRVGWDVFGFSLGTGIYYSLTQRTTNFNKPHYGYLELSYIFIRDN